MRQPHKHSEVIKAWADGAEIQCRIDNQQEWVGIKTTPTWNVDWEYRVKPEPKPDVVVDAYIIQRSDIPRGYEFYLPGIAWPANIKFVFDGETGKLKAAEVL